MKWLILAGAILRGVPEAMVAAGINGRLLLAARLAEALVEAANGQLKSSSSRLPPDPLP